MAEFYLKHSSVGHLKNILSIPSGYSLRKPLCDTVRCFWNPHSFFRGPGHMWLVPDGRPWQLARSRHSEREKNKNREALCVCLPAEFFSFPLQASTHPPKAKTAGGVQVPNHACAHHLLLLLSKWYLRYPMHAKDIGGAREKVRPGTASFLVIALKTT